MAANITYHEQTDMDNIRKLREVLKTLPAFAKDYFRAIEPTTSTKPAFLMPMISGFFPVSDISESVSCKNRDSELKRFRTGSVKTDRY